MFWFFAYKSYRKLSLGYDIKFIHRIYYLIVILYIALLVIFFDNQISTIDFFNTSNLDARYAINILLLFAFFVIWEFIFISCKTFKLLKFKDIELSLEDKSSLTYIDKFQEKQIECLYSVLNAKIEMVKYIDSYIDNEVIEPYQSYIDILNEYKEKRKGVKVYAYFNNDNGIRDMQRELNINDNQLTSIMYSISIFEFCFPKNFKKKDYIFYKIKTKFVQEDLLVVLKSSLLIDNENSILADIINYFELKISFELAYNTSEEL